MATILVTGGAGFIGSNFIHYMRDAHPDDKIIVLDALTYAGNRENLRQHEGVPGFTFHHGDVCDREAVEPLVEEADAVVHFAAETHVDRSIMYADQFIRTDVFGTFVMLEACRKLGIERFVFISTDEVYGEAPGRPSVESDALMPKSPYAASKAGADRLAYSYFTTYGTPVVITRCSNNYGPYQYPEKLIPLFITNLYEHRKVPVYGTGKNTRDWVHVMDHCAALDLALSVEGIEGEVFNIGTGDEKSILEITEILLEELGKSSKLVKRVTDRPGHVQRHAVDSAKARKVLGWEPSHSFRQGMTETATWYKENVDWWRKIKEKKEVFGKYYKEQYGETLG